MRFNKLFLYASFLFLISCNGAIVYKEFDLQAETEAWIVQEDDFSFQMVDENGIVNNWNLTEEDNYYSESSGTFLFIPTDKTMREVHYQKFRSAILGDFSFSADAGFSEVNPWISFNMPHLYFEFDAVTHKPNRLYLSPNSGESFTWADYEEVDQPFDFKVVTDLEIKGDTYPEEVAVFELIDQMGILESKSIVKFAFSKDIGLIYLELKSGLKYYRI
ncbi:hypothetical protein [Marivirga arenosa]|uniref:Uncharacterized protein n=1 Tax=Marivirga arenosa TaxID=3059076 RepID=A0AA49GDL9_9BACT|nr:hypothetical protein [Marivirga sp. BKB1-2]WKK82304.2 hypothetical protein QYS47_09470 [Marivirga sp. BKB1-2]